MLSRLGKVYRASCQQVRDALSGSTFLKHVIAVSGSTVALQAISLVVAPINTRLYQPEDYGLLAVFGACFSVFSIVATMRYEGAMPVAEDNTEGTHLLVLSLIFTGIWTFLATIVAIVAGDNVSGWLTNDDRFQKYIWFLPAGIFSISIFNILSSWAVRQHAFPDLSMARIMQSLSGSGSTIFLGLLHAGTVGMIVGHLVSNFSGILKLFLMALRDIRKQAPFMSFSGLIQAARRHYRFPFYNAPALLLNTFSVQLPIVMLTSGFGANCTGYFAICQRILLLPTLLISGAITPVFYSRAKQARHDGALSSFSRRVVESIAGVNAFFIMFVAIFGEPVFALLFGNEWSRSGSYAAALAPWLLLNFLVTPLASLPLVFERQGADLLFQIGLLTVRAGSLLLGIHFQDDMVAMITFGGSSALFMTAYLAWLLRLVSVPLGPVLWKVGRELLLAAVLLGACRLVMWWTNENLIITAGVLAPVLVFSAVRTIQQIKDSRAAVKVSAVALT